MYLCNVNQLVINISNIFYRSYYFTIALFQANVCHKKHQENTKIPSIIINRFKSFVFEESSTTSSQDEESFIERNISDEISNTPSRNMTEIEINTGDKHDERTEDNNLRSKICSEKKVIYFFV